jgi:hypothetical protein
MAGKDEERYGVIAAYNTSGVSGIVKTFPRMRFALFWDTTQYKVDFLTLEDETDRLSRNAGTELQLYAA